MDINSLIDSLVNSIATDTALTAWCNSTYNKAHTVFVSFDERVLPGESDCPFVVVYPVQKQVGQSRGVKSHHVEIDCCIFDESLRTFTPGNITGYAGVQRIEQFRKLVETAVTSTSLTNCLFDGLDVEYDVISQFPFHQCGMLFEINEKSRVGTDLFE